MNKRLRICNAGLLGLALLLAPAAIAVADTHDTLITTKAKIKLLTAKDVSVSDVNVDTNNGKVVLHGKVETEGEKTKAEAVVREISGVKDVQNLLQVVPKSRKEAVEASDEQITKAVKEHLKAKGLNDVKVQSVNKGVVLLAGKAPTLSAKLNAIEAAYEVPGVQRVASEITTESERAEK